MKVAVVIPFYQRTRGLLATTVKSIAAQQVADDVVIDIIVVDDGSPVHAASEPIVTVPAHCSLRIIVRDNGGVAAARNTGLDAVAPDTDYVAFIDSDDVWMPGHLASAVACLARGAEFYFDNSFVDPEFAHFSKYAYMKEHHSQLDPQAPVCRQIDREEAFDAIVRRCIPHTSQVVFSFAAHRQLRFDQDQTKAGEDHLFWIELAHRSRATAYNTAIMGNQGRGVSIYRETVPWDSPNILSRVIDEMMMRKKVLARYELTEGQRATVVTELQKSCNHLVFLSLRNSFRQPRKVVAALTRVTRDFPLAWRMMPTALWRLPAHRTDLLARR